MILAATGHRPDKLGGYSRQAREKLTDFAEIKLAELKPDIIISGMALGWDQAIALAALSLGIPLHAYIPFSGQESKWPADSQKLYADIMSKATAIVNCGGEGYGIWKMQRRNEDMVNASDVLLALWNGSAGGTCNCVNYASRAGVTEVVNVWDEWAKEPEATK